MECCEIGDEELFGLKPTKTVNMSSQWVDFGWYRDENGNMHHGAIPNKNKYEIRWRN